MTGRPLPIDAERRFVRCVIAAALAGGAAGWILVGELWGAAGIWILIVITALLLASAAHGLGADDSA
jgi:hypothetical protein